LTANKDIRGSCYISIPYAGKYEILRECVRDALKRADLKSIVADPNLSHTPSNASFEAIASCDMVVADVSDNNPLTWVEIGTAQTMNKPIIFIRNVKKSNRNSNLLSRGLIIEHNIIDYDIENLNSFYQILLEALQDLSRTSGRFETRKSLNSRLPFFIDWDILEPREIENLCRELMVLMGYRQVDWIEQSKEIDLIAEYPRKDPDGFEFKELWCISMGFKAPMEMLLDMAMEDPEYFFDRITRYSGRFRDSVINYASRPITFLFIGVGSREQKEFDFFQRRFEKRMRSRKFGRSSIRLRLWDRNYLTSVVQQYPNIGFKYFSNEGRARAKTRKSFEELYRENNDLLSRQRKLNEELRLEKDRRVRAERDAVWKDISFSAAHKIGNPIFAIETGLIPLNKRIRENKSDDALEITSSISRSINKAKSFVEQFKSMTKAQQIEPISGKLKPLLIDVQQWLNSKEVTCSIRCRKDLGVFADFKRLSECFDELAVNAIRWLEKSGKTKNNWKVQISAKIVEKGQVADFLDTSTDYVRINFKNNGPGIPIDKKEKIFEAFVTEHPHGTGLGLALVRRIIEGHEGKIIEVGKPSMGADFEIYLPVKSA